MREYSSDDGEFVIGSLVKINTWPSDCNHEKIGLIVRGADPFFLERLPEIVIENWLYREIHDDGYFLEPSYIVRIEDNDWIYAESELELINAPVISLFQTGSFG